MDKIRRNNHALFWYSGLVFNSTDVIPTIDQIDHSFGATHPGIYDPEKRIFTLNFRGLSFTFPVEQASEPRYVRGLGSLQFTNGASPIATKMFIFSGNSLVDSKPPSLPISCFFSHPYLQWLEVIRHNGCTSGIKLSIICEGLAQKLINLKTNFQINVILRFRSISSIGT